MLIPATKNLSRDKNVAVIFIFKNKKLEYKSFFCFPVPELFPGQTSGGLLEVWLRGSTVFPIIRIHPSIKLAGANEPRRWRKWWIVGKGGRPKKEKHQSGGEWARGKH